ncbi:MAG: 2,3-butanediol dehydrogenase [Actinomycetaceae bacterium]|nr:2,3-butanediol dehydrogenase [Actinomycetaceae bacterium]
MKAARFYSAKDIRIEDIEQQVLEPGTVRVDVAYCGICGTDLHEYLEGPIFCPSVGHPHPISGEELPVTLGHEFSGVISEVGEGVEGLEVGDHVVVEPYIINDDVDTSEKSTDYHLSQDMNFIGLAGRGGGLSENVVVKQRWVHKISKDVALDEAALIEPLSVAMHAVDKSKVQEGETALVVGGGPIGQLVCAVLKAKGVRTFISEPSPLRRQKAVDAGNVVDAFNPMEIDVPEKMRELTGGAGADVCFEVTSVQAGIDTCLDAVRTQGTVVNVSIWSKPASIDMHKIVMKECYLTGIIAYVNNHPETIALVESGKVDLKPFITKKIALENLIDDGFDTLINHNETAVKILIDPAGRNL